MKQSFFARHSFTILLFSALLMPLMFAGARRALETNSNDVAQWLPKSFEETTVYEWFRTHFESEQFILISWEGCTADDPRLELLARKLVPENGDAATARADGLFIKAITGPRILDQLIAPPSKLDPELAKSRLTGLLFGPDGEQTCAVITLSELGKENLRHTVGTIYDIAELECDLPREKIRMGGPPIDNVAIDIESERTLYRLAAGSAFVGLGIAWLCLRSVRLTLIVFTAAVYAAAMSLAAVWYAGERMNAILLTMPSLVYVLSISGAIHIVNYFRDAAQEEGLDGATDRAIAHGWLPCTLAATTTALGLGSLYINDLIPIKLFGLYSAIGVLASLLLLLFFLPAAIQFWALDTGLPSANKRRAVASESRFGRYSLKIGRTVIRRNALVTFACLAVMVFFGVGLFRVETTVRLMKLFSPEAEIVHHYRWLEEELGPLVPMEVVIHVDDRCRLNFLERMELVERAQNRIEAMDEVGGAWSAVTFAPDLDMPERFAPSRGGGLGSGLSHVMGLGNAKKLGRNILSDRLAEHRDDFVEGDFLSEEDGVELWRISARVDALADVDYGEFVDDIQAQVDPLLAGYRKLGVEGIDVTYTGLIPLVYKAQRSLLNGLINSFGLAFVLIAVVMMVVLRGTMAGLLSMIPNVFPAVVIFGMMGWLGIVIDIGSMMTASVALGVAVDDTVHFMTWYRRGLLRGLDRREATLNAYARCARAMAQTTAIGGLGLAVFAFSSFTPTQRFGYLMLVLLVAALVGDLLLLPAMLSGRVGRFFSRRLSAAAAEHKASTESAPQSPSPTAVKASSAEMTGPRTTLPGARKSVQT